MTRSIPNEVANIAAYAVTDTPGTPTAPASTFMLLGDLAITKTQDLVDKEESTGGYLRRVTPKQAPPTFAGTYGEDLTFESYPILNRYAIKGGATGTSDGNGTPGYDRTQAPSHNVDDIEQMALQYGINGQMWESRGVQFDEHTVTIDADDADGVWKWSSNLSVQSKDVLATTVTATLTAGTSTTLTSTGASWTVNAYAGMFVFLKYGSHIEEVRKIVSNTATVLTVDEAFTGTPTAGDVIRIEPKPPTVAVPTWEAIPTYGTRFWLDPSTGTIGTTELIDRVVSVSYTVATNRKTKRFLNNPKNKVAAKTGRGAMPISGSITLENDRRTEFTDWENLARHKMRIQQIGSQINGSPATYKTATVDFVDIAFGSIGDQARENNMTITVPFFAYGTVNPIAVKTKNTLATLP